ncbi:MAG: ATP synthase F1 subunit delta [Bacteroidales bacterium]|nr:ATP synthase F1 subunit delta [Bacteroidales bacterium]
MNGGLIAKRYAAALQQYAAECGQQEECYRDSRALLSALSPMAEFLRSPVEPARKLELLQKAVSGRCSAFDGFLKLVVAHRREGRLTTILKSYQAAYKKACGIVAARLTVAGEASPQLLEKLEALTKEHTGAKSVEIEVVTDPAIIGGFIYKVEDRRLDASVLRQINDLKKAFEFNNKNRII